MYKLNPLPTVHSKVMILLFDSLFAVVDPIGCGVLRDWFLFCDVVHIVLSRLAIIWLRKRDMLT